MTTTFRALVHSKFVPLWHTDGSAGVFALMHYIIIEMWILRVCHFVAAGFTIFLPTRRIKSSEPTTATNCANTIGKNAESAKPGVIASNVASTVTYDAMNDVTAVCSIGRTLMSSFDFELVPM